MKAKIANSKRLNIPGNGDLSSNREILAAMLKSWRQKLGYYSMFAALPAIFTPFAQEAQAEEAKKTEVSGAGHTILLPHQKSKYSRIISELAGGDNCPGTAIPGGNYTAATPFTDSGNTTGANNTVKRAHWIHYTYYWYDAAGPDQIYTFTLTGRSANPQIQVSATSANYNPMIYILDGRFNGGCPGGTENNAFNELVVFDSRWTTGSTATLNSFQMDSLPLNVPLYLFVDSKIVNDSGPYNIRIQDVTIAPVLPPPRTRFDFDGDGRADISVFRPSDGFWHLNRSLHGFFATQFGLSTDKITPADFDGDGRTDIAVFRDGVWYWLKSSDNSFNTIHFGLANDIPVPADFTGDGRAELAVYRGGIWYTLDLQNNQFSTVQFGLATDKPVVGDYDGDGRADFAVYRDGVWYLLRSQQGFAAIHFGLATDKLVPADYDGDGKTDLAVYREGVWYLLRSQSGFTAFQFGLASDIPAPADYDGDGKADAAVYRDGNWYLLQSANGFGAEQLGLTSDKPVPTAYLP